MPRYQRPDLPYAAAPLRNNNRYSLIATANQPVSADALEADANYGVDSLNDLYAQLLLVVAQGLPGVNNPANVNKFPVTDGVATVSWSKITAAFFSAACIPTAALQNGCVTNPILGAGSVENENIVDGAVQNNNITDNTLSFDKIIDENNAHFQQFFNNQDVGTLEGSTIAAGSLPASAIAPNSLPGTVITTGTLPAAALVANSIATAQLSPLVQIPIGTSFEWNGASGIAAPTGWLEEDGSAVSRTTYALLFAVIGVTFGAGDGSTTFNIPDSRGRTSFSTAPFNGGTAGRIVTQTAIAGVGGEEFHTLSLTEIPAHTHTYFSYTRSNAISSGGGNYPSVDSPGNSTGSAGSNAAHNNMPPYILKRKIIYAGV